MMPQNSIEDQLDELLAKILYSKVEDEAKKQPFIIDNDIKAEWAVKHIIECQNKIDKTNKFAAERIAQVKQLQQEITAENERSIEFFLGLLRPYAEKLITKISKTVKLPSGNISFHSRDPVFFISGEKVSGKNKTLTERVEQLAPELIITEKSTNWTEFKNTLTVMEDGRVISSNGEILDFIEAVECPDSVNVKERK